jgi:hypothetical protein
MRHQMITKESRIPLACNCLFFQIEYDDDGDPPKKKIVRGEEFHFSQEEDTSLSNFTTYMWH